MPKEYRTIQEVAGPLMLVKSVENVKYDELGEIELANGETRRCKVLEINGSDALVQLLKLPQVSTSATVKYVSSAAPWNSVFPRICSDASSTVWDVLLTTVPKSFRMKDATSTVFR